LNGVEAVGAHFQNVEWIQLDDDAASRTAVRFRHRAQVAAYVVHEDAPPREIEKRRQKQSFGLTRPVRGNRANMAVFRVAERIAKGWGFSFGIVGWEA
jgi:hypothetical protein